METGNEATCIGLVWLLLMEVITVHVEAMSSYTDIKFLLTSNFLLLLGEDKMRLRMCIMLLGLVLFVFCLCVGVYGIPYKLIFMSGAIITATIFYLLR